MFDTTLFEKELSTSWLGRELFFFDELESTNTFAKNIEREGSKHGALIITDHQIAGRGQYDRIWGSAASSNLTFSLILEPSHSERLTVLTLSAALAIAETVEEQSKATVTLKWPNDVIVNEHKIAGLLTETLFNGNSLERVILGIGLNVNQDDFEEDIHGKATSLKKISLQHTPRERFLAKLLSRIEFYYRLWDTINVDLIKHINKKLIGYGKWVRLKVNDVELEGEFKFLGINETGHLVVLNKALEVNTFSYEQVRVHFDSKTD